MDTKHMQGKRGCHTIPNVRQGDIWLVDFGHKRKGSRSLFGKRPVYVMNASDRSETMCGVMGIPLFRCPSVDTAVEDIEILPHYCHGLRYAEYAQPLNIQRIRAYQIVRRIGHVNKCDIHQKLMLGVMEQIKKQAG